MSDTRRACGNSGIGGQAVLEGIMMRNQDKYAIAVRKPDGEIEVRTEDFHHVIALPGIRKIPIVRGFVSFLDSLVIGIRCLMISASYQEDEEPVETEKSDTLFIAGTLAVAFAMAILLFMAAPYLLSRVLGGRMQSSFGKSVLEALLRVAIFLGYMLLISRLKDIQRTFAYHGAEHKCINCIENGLPLTLENVMRSSREHKRCGTSFLFFVIMVSVVFQMFIFAESRVAQIGIRLLLIPLIAGISYEIIRLAGSTRNRFIAALSKPGLLLQRLTTREPDEEEAEVAIRAVEAVFDWKHWQEEAQGIPEKA